MIIDKFDQILATFFRGFGSF